MVIQKSKSWRKWSFIYLIVILLIACIGNKVSAYTFSADMVEHIKGQTFTNRFYYMDNRYRMDIVQDGKLLYILVDREVGKTRVLIPDEKIYFEMDNTDMRSLMNNPFEAHFYMATLYEIVTEGEESLEGLKCDRKSIKLEGQIVQTVWVARKYNFPVKITIHGMSKEDTMTVELKNIRENKLDPALFSVPSDFKLVKSMPAPLPEWVEDIPQAPIMTPPFEKKMSTGEIVRIKPIRDFDIKISTESISPQKSSITAVAFKDGHPLRDISLSTFNFDFQKIFKESPEEADEFVVRVNKGGIILRAWLEEAPEGIVLKKDFLRSNSGKDFDVKAGKDSVLQLIDDGSDGIDSQGVVAIITYTEKSMEGGVIYYEPKLLEEINFNLKNGKSQTWKFPADKKVGLIRIDVNEGGVTVRIEQPIK